MSFQEAILELTGSGAAYVAPQPKADNHIHETKALVLPKKCEGKYSRAFAYLNKTRFIDPQIIYKMIAEKKIFQDDHNNVVFVGYNEDKKAAFACVRGTNTKVQYRGDCDGSDKRYAFSMEGKGSSGKLYVFEAPIDLLSHATMSNKITGKGTYSTMLLLNQLTPHLKAIDDQAWERFDQIVKELAEADGTDEELKMNDQLEWVGRMNNYRETAREIVIKEIVETGIDSII